MKKIYFLIFLLILFSLVFIPKFALGSSITSPSEATQYFPSFTVTVSGDVGNNCWYAVYSNGVQTRLGFRTCNSSFTVTVGQGADCRNFGSATCRVYVYDGVTFSDSRVYSIGCIPPTPTITSPDAGSWQSGNFSVFVSDPDPDSGNFNECRLAYCKYNVYDAGRGVYKGWTDRICNSSFTVTVGPTGDCQREGENICSVSTRAWNNAGQTGAIGSRSFSITAQPPVTSISLSGTAGAGDWFISDVQVTLTCSDTISGCATTYYCYSSSPGCTNFTSCTPPCSFTISSGGTNYLNYYSVDKSGIQESTKSSTVKIDKTYPTVNISLSGLMGLNDWYVSDVTATINCSDPESGCASIKYCLNVGSCTCPYGESIANWPAYSGPVTISTEGQNCVNAAAINGAGFLESAQKTFKMDKSEPVTSISYSISGCSATVTLTCSDTYSGCYQTKYCVDSTNTCEPASGNIYTGPFYVSGLGTHYVRYKSYDNAGLVELTGSTPITITDTSPPSSSFSSPGAGTWQGSPSFTVSISSTDVGCGVGNHYYRIYDSTAGYTTGWISGGSSFSVSVGSTANCRTQGTNTCTVYAYAVDVAGNTGNTVNRTFSIDWEKPVTSIKCNDTSCSTVWYTSDVKITLACSDNLSGCSASYYCFGSGCTPGTSYTGAFYITTEGTNIIRYRSKDNTNTGNPEDIHEISVKLDKFPPTTSIQCGEPAGACVPGKWYKEDVKITLPCSDTASGCAATYYCVDQANTCDPRPEAAGILYTTPFYVQNEGINWVRYYSVDNTGHTEPIH